MLKKQLTSLVANSIKRLSARHSETNTEHNNNTTETESILEREFQQEQEQNQELQEVNNSQITEINKINLGENVDYFEKQSKHRAMYTIYDLKPTFTSSFVAPNATVVGAVKICAYSFIGFNAVIRGDINNVTIGNFCCVGDHTVINTVNSLPTGIPSVVEIGQHVTIQSRCSLTSCLIEDQVFIGHGSVILEGARIETGAIILPNSVVPPGRIIPANQVWGGNPVRYVRDVRPAEVFSNYTNTYEIWKTGRGYRELYDNYSYSYLDQELTKEDVDLTPDIVERFINDKDKFNTLPHNDFNKNYLL